MSRERRQEAQRRAPSVRVWTVCWVSVTLGMPLAATRGPACVVLQDDGVTPAGLYQRRELLDTFRGGQRGRSNRAEIGMRGTVWTAPVAHGSSGPGNDEKRGSSARQNPQGQRSFGGVTKRAHAAVRPRGQSLRLFVTGSTGGNSGRSWRWRIDNARVFHCFPAMNLPRTGGTF